MTKKKRYSGITLVEAVLSFLILGFLFLVVIKGIEVFNRILWQHIRLSQLLEVNQLNFDITKTVRNARKISAVDFDLLNVEVYNYQDFPAFDRRTFEQPRLIRYRYVVDPQPHILREVFSSTQPTAVLLTQHQFLRNIKTVPPTPSRPYFKNSYMVNGSTRGVSVSIRLNSFFRREWLPIPAEASVYGQGI